MARTGQRRDGARRTAGRHGQRARTTDLVGELARAVRDVEAAAKRGRVTPSVRATFQAVALLLREERARVRAAAMSDSQRGDQLKRLEGIATILATTAVRDSGLLALRGEDAVVSDAARRTAREIKAALGVEPEPEEEPEPVAAAPVEAPRRVVPQSVVS
ncbi:MAG: ATP-dependent helicase, partial [Actinobacteria bacterium]|nr:ATP-dependent helicase [Actinomycetota bacterium]